MMRLRATAFVASASLALLMPAKSFILPTCPHTTSIGQRQGQSASCAGPSREYQARFDGETDTAGALGRVGAARIPPLSAIAQEGVAQLRPPLAADFYSESLLDKVALALFRVLVQKEIGYKSEEPGYAGLIDEAQNYMVIQGASVEDQQDMVVRVLTTIAGPAVPPVYKLFMAPWPWAPFLTAFFTPPFFKFLVGPNKLDARKDDTPGGVFVERCRFLEETNCKGLCTNMCKIPTERFFEETLGLTMAMEPDFDTYECRLSFGLESPAMEEDDTVPRGCLSGCSCKELGAVVATTCSKQ
ncbi:conserved unknown protein [Ectocarpus siliculosus]|uniref:Beta-carotene isomerase D27-like C-terminal domain-containing protein n=1 Tax=Ectocarpus siliculosus TaxID=2880 RepID=D7G4X4_ECTSI|nr:conserved unknown protein [Ectocarpus siliculosus]|eukprot:CBJ33737.1 conserved unknown protein [Ectocarpus siliculosus]